MGLIMSLQSLRLLIFSLSFSIYLFFLVVYVCSFMICHSLSSFINLGIHHSFVGPISSSFNRFVWKKVHRPY